MIGRIGGKWSVWQATRRVTRATQVLHGPPRVTLPDDGVAAVVLVRDAAYFLPAMLAHHFARGIDHIVVIDNGSTDATVAIAAGFDRVTVVRNTLPVAQYESRLRAQIAARVLRGGWVLFVDADEMAEVPLAPPAAAFAALARYCNAAGYTAVMAQMLDLVSPAPYGDTAVLGYPAAVAECDRYTLEGIAAFAYRDPLGAEFQPLLAANTAPPPEVRWLVGGLRRRAFGEACLLTKHSFVRNLPGLTLMSHPHCATGVRVADVTFLLRHYKFAGPWQARDAATVAAAVWQHAQDARRVSAAGGPAFRFDLAAARVWSGVDALLDAGFLTASPAYRTAMAPAAPSPSPAYSPAANNAANPSR